MKIETKIVSCALLWSVSTAIAQDLLPSAVGTPALPTQDNAPSPAATASPSPAIPLALIPAPLPSPSGTGALPPAAPNLPDLSQLDQFIQQSKLGKEVEDYRVHVEWRQLKNRTIYDPAVVAAKKAADAATTDLEKRNRLRAYYETYYSRMQALASSPQMVAYLEAMKTAHINMLAQPRVRPTPETARQSD
jgi:hypothetical protein